MSKTLDSILVEIALEQASNRPVPPTVIVIDPFQSTLRKRTREPQEIPLVKE